ncbi:MAG: ABC transporter substrate-binding protein [Acidimicrobiia bacterium]
MRKVLLLTYLAVLCAACATADIDGPEGFSTTIVGTDGREVSLEAAPARIVSLSATHTEILYAVGAADQIAGTDLTSDFPPEAQTTPKVDALNFNVEEVAVLDPDLVILAFDFQGEVEALERIGIPALVLAPAVTIEGMYEQITVLGIATGRAAAAAELIADMTMRMEAAVQGFAPGGQITVYHEVDATLFSPNSATFLGDLYSRFGLVNIADEVPDEFGSGYVQLSPEYILATDPDVIFLGDADFGETVETVAARPGWSTLSAVATDRVYGLDGDVVGRWGPRTVELAESVRAALDEATG